ncbi:MAG: hypothetical protein IJ099_00605 [Alphaproteobacteria bacterium]|nr:hypothetical protein [Alphaproteobacteria bacterium]
MQQIPVIVISSSREGTGKTTLALNLAAAMWCDGYDVGLLTNENNAVRNFMQKRRELSKQYNIKMPFPILLEETNEFPQSANEKKVIIADIAATDNQQCVALFGAAHTLITVAATRDDLNWPMNHPYANVIWQAKKQLASKNAGFLNWIVVPDQLTAASDDFSSTLGEMAKRHGFRVAPSLHFRSAFQHINDGYCAADMALFPEVLPMTMADVYARREILTLTDFLWR